MDWKNYTLSVYFAENFLSFTVSHFVDFSANSRRELRDIRRAQGVYVRKGRKDPSPEL